MARFDPETYIDVQERIVRFWQEHPDGQIVTNLMSDPNDWSVCRYKAEVYWTQGDARPAATGWAFEIAAPADAKIPNATSHEENCETSCIGRALANMGYAKTRADRPSRQEMDKVNRGSASQAATPSPAASSFVEAHTDVLNEYARQIRAAPTIEVLQTVGQEMASAGVGSPELRRLYHERGQSFGANGGGKR